MAQPGSMLNTIRLVRGQTKVLHVTVKDRNGRPADLTNATLYFTARQSSTSAVLICKTNGDGIEITDPSCGEATITLSSTDTEIEKGQYHYDIWVEYAGTPPIRHPVVKYAELCVEERLASFSCS